MLLNLWALLVFVSLVLITIGLIKQDQTAQAIVGFFFLFLLSLPMLVGTLQIENGTNVTTTFSYNDNGSITGSTQELDYNYQEWDDSTSHQIGFWMAITSSIGFFVILFSLEGVRMRWDKWRGRD